MNFSELNKFSITSDFLKKISKLDYYKCNFEHKKKIEKNKKIQEELFIPKYNDTLFWCYYILINSIGDYEMVGSDFKEEKMVKISLIQTIRENKEILKKFKIKRTEVEDDLLNKKTISVKTFFILCFLKGINIIIKDDVKFLENINNDKKVEIIEKQGTKYGLFVGNKEKKIEKCRETCWKIDGFDFSKALRSLSYYKLKNLQDICKKLNIITEKDGKKLRKKDLYNELLLKLN